MENVVKKITEMTENTFEAKADDLKYGTGNVTDISYDGNMLKNFGQLHVPTDTFNGITVDKLERALSSIPTNATITSISTTKNTNGNPVIVLAYEHEYKIMNPSVEEDEDDYVTEQPLFGFRGRKK